MTKQVTFATSRRAAVLALLDALGVLPIHKQEDPLDRDEFAERFVALATALRLTFRAAEARALRRLAGVFDRDWENLTAAQRNAALREATEVLRRVPRGMRGRLLERIEAAALRMERRARNAARRRFDLDVPARVPADRVAEAMALAAPTPLFIEEEFERRANRLADVLKIVLAAALAARLSRREITNRLTAEAEKFVRRPEYFGGVAAAVLNRARTGALLAAFAEAGVTKFRIVEVLDDRTCVKCRFMHGMEFAVADARKLMRRLSKAKTPAQIAKLNPFLRQGRNPDGTAVVYLPGPDGQRRVVAKVTENAEGQDDEVGRFADVWTDEQLAAAGVMFPPYHPLCRGVPVPA